MTALIVAVLASCRTMIRSRLELAAEILALRHQLAVLQRTAPTATAPPPDRPAPLGAAFERLAELAARGEDRDAGYDNVDMIVPAFEHGQNPAMYLRNMRTYDGTAGTLTKQPGSGNFASTPAVWVIANGKPVLVAAK